MLGVVCTLGESLHASVAPGTPVEVPVASAAAAAASLISPPVALTLALALALALALELSVMASPTLTVWPFNAASTPWACCER